jgi:hypothetical protein
MVVATVLAFALVKVLAQVLVIAVVRRWELD